MRLELLVWALGGTTLGWWLHACYTGKRLGVRTPSRKERRREALDLVYGYGDLAKRAAIVLRRLEPVFAARELATGSAHEADAIYHRTNGQMLESDLCAVIDEAIRRRVGDLDEGARFERVRAVRRLEGLPFFGNLTR